MAKTDKDVEPACNVPGCEEPHKTRGLCAKHYWRLMRGKGADQAEAQYHAAPPKRGPLAALAKTGAAPAASSATAGAPQARAAGAPDESPASSEGEADRATHQEYVQERIDELIATTTELCTMLGIKRIDGKGTRHFVNPANGRIVELTDDGLLYKGELRRLTG